MRKLIPWAATPAAWTDSELALPTVDAAADAAAQRWCAVAGGLALILSRVSASERAARFPCTHTLYTLVRSRLRQSRPVLASPELVSEVMHETAEIADPLTRSCLKTCFQASLRRPDAANEPSQPAARAGALASPGSPASVPQRMRAAPADSSPPTSVMPQALVERSAELRRRLAAARSSTGFAELE